jgi:hypothetical protein
VGGIESVANVAARRSFINKTLARAGRGMHRGRGGVKLKFRCDDAAATEIRRSRAQQYKAVSYRFDIKTADISRARLNNDAGRAINSAAAAAARAC